MRLYPAVKASVIQCPIQDCIFACVDDSASSDSKQLVTDQLITRFNQHLFKHGIELKNEYLKHIQSLIVELRTNNKIHYIDPFIAISYENVIKNRYC